MISGLLYLELFAAPINCLRSHFCSSSLLRDLRTHSGNKLLSYVLVIASGATKSKTEAISSIKRLQKIFEYYPNTEIIFGHEPSQWCDAEGLAIDDRFWQE